MQLASNFADFTVRVVKKEKKKQKKKRRLTGKSSHVNISVL